MLYIKFKYIYLPVIFVIQVVPVVNGFETDKYSNVDVNITEVIYLLIKLIKTAFKGQYHSCS